jgi:hypothetical protein
MPGTRRSVVETLSAEQKAFLSGSECSDAGRASHGPIGADTPKATSEQCPPSPTGQRRGEPLRSVTLRLRPDVVSALRRAAAERSLRYDEPFTQQAIAEAALAAWLSKLGYAPD